MSGQNVSALEIPAGIFSDTTQYATGKRWFDGNLVRWVGGILTPIGGWRSIANFGALPILNAQVPPPIDLTNRTPPTNYSFVAAPLGANALKKVLVGVSMRMGAAVEIPTLTVAGISCSLVDGAIIANQFVGWFLSDSVIAQTTGTIVVTVNTGGAIQQCMVFPYEYIGKDPPFIYKYRAVGSGLSVTTGQKLLIPPKSIGLAITSANAAADPIQWTWPGYAQDNSYSVSETSIATAHNIPVGLNTIDEFITGAGTQTVARSLSSIVLPEVVGDEPIRDMITWRDNLKAPWLSAGSADKLWGLSVNADNTYTPYNITPATLAWNPGGQVGYGAGAYGDGPYGANSSSGGSITIDASAQWSMDNFGKLLIAVHSQDGRLFSWDPVTPATVAAPVVTAPIDNTLCLMSNEEFCFVLGGKNNPRRVKWASQRSLTDWTPTATNSAGGFDLQSHGVIKAAVKVPEGILVVTGADVHLIQWIGAPNYYGRRKISDEGSIISKDCLVPIPGGAMWMGNSDFWVYLGGTVTKLPCSVHTDAFYYSELSQPQNVFLGVNEIAGEVWAFFPLKGGNTPTNYVLFNYSKEGYWSKGKLSRTAWCNPVWQARPLAALDQTLFEQEFGVTADGVSRTGTIFAETGAFEIGEGDNVIRADRIYQDAGVEPNNAFAISDPLAFTATFKLRQAPNAPERTYGPVSLGDPKGYTTVRFRARQLAMRIDQTKDEQWLMGKLRLRIKAGGKR
jgi:hypothetical protein